MSFSLLEKFQELNAWQWILFSLLAVVAIFCIVSVYRSLSKNTDSSSAVKKRFDTRALVYGAMCVSLAFVLSYIRFFRMPQGGSITLGSILPIILYAYWYGPKRGFTAAFACSILQFIQDPVVLSIPQVILDYTLAYTALGLAAFFPKNIYLATIVSGVSKIIFSVLSGVIFFASYAPEGMHPLVYSASYNFGVYTPDLLICLVLVFALQTSGAIRRLCPTNAGISVQKAA